MTVQKVEDSVFLCEGSKSCCSVSMYINPQITRYRSFVSAFESSEEPLFEGLCHDFVRVVVAEENVVHVEGAQKAIAGGRGFGEDAFFSFQRQPALLVKEVAEGAVPGGGCNG
jgi:hypothetical protein